ncbi:MAG: helicase-related protein [Nitrososphaeraceae archaeon]|nr:helicase-related protein [Nitrososphaeraceae archaeon]MDW3630296.1 helicase-related protein [Nitrososphaeraceae archaeon]
MSDFRNKKEENIQEMQRFIVHPLIKNNSIESRLYQNIIFNSSKDKNSLIVLPTSLGKTVISALICAEILYNYKQNRILIMAPTRPLVLQHLLSFSSFLKVLDDQKILVTGKISPSTRKMIWDNKTIKLIFATPEVIRNDLNESRLNLKDFGLIVFDEAHRAIKDYAYTLISKKYMEQSPNPLIVAMTASPGSDKNRIQQICNNLYIEHIEYRNEEDADVKPYVNPIELKWEFVELSEKYRQIILLFKSMLQEKLRWLIFRGLIKKNNIDYVFKRDLLELAEILQRNLKFTLNEEKGPLYLALLNQSAALSLMYCIELIESQGPFSLKTFIKRMESSEGKAHSLILKDPRMKDIFKLLENVTEHPKLIYILNLCKKEKLDTSANKNPNVLLNDSMSSQILIFSHYRDTATHIVDELNKTGIKSFRFVGQSTRNNDIGMKQNEQSVILDSFRKKEFNVLVATSIAEEGLDIPEVKLVIFYEPVASEIRHIQRKGRTGRKSSGNVIILAAKDTVDMRILFANKRRIEKMKTIFNTMKTILTPISRVPIPYNRLTELELADLDKNLNIEQKKLNEKELKYEDNERKVIEKIKVKNAIIDKVPKFQIGMITKTENNLIERAYRHIYNFLIDERNNKNSFDLSYFHDKFTFDTHIILEALKKLEKQQVIKIKNNRSITLNRLPNKSTGKEYNIYVEKILSGKAYVLVNEKWYALLNYYDYEGPRNLLKKGSEFKAIAELYTNGNHFCIRIKEIIL